MTGEECECLRTYDEELEHWAMCPESYVRRYDNTDLRWLAEKAAQDDVGGALYAMRAVEREIRYRDEAIEKLRKGKESNG